MGDRLGIPGAVGFLQLNKINIYCMHVISQPACNKRDTNIIKMFNLILNNDVYFLTTLYLLFLYTFYINATTNK
jgi:hypothetical protein